MKNYMLLFGVMFILGCAASWEEKKQEPVPVTVVGPVTITPTEPEDIPTPSPTPVSCQHPTGPKVITSSQCVDLVEGLDKKALECLRKYLKKGYTSYPHGDSILIIDKVCRDFILYYNCTKCK